jgi:hypothetical protein
MYLCNTDVSQYSYQTDFIMTNRPPFYCQIMLTVAFSCLTLFANAQNAEEARQRNNAANEAASKAQYDRNKAISTGRGAPNPLQGLGDAEKEQRIAAEKKEWEKEKAEKARELAKFKEDYAKNAGQRAIDASVSANKIQQVEAFAGAFVLTGLVEQDALEIADSGGYDESMDKLREMNPKIEYLKGNIASANFEALDTALRQLISSRAPFTALKYINQLDRFTAKETEIDALTMAALAKIYSINYRRGGDYFEYSEEAYRKKHIHDVDEKKLFDLYLKLEDKYPNFFCEMPGAYSDANSDTSGPYFRISMYYYYTYNDYNNGTLMTYKAEKMQKKYKSRKKQLQKKCRNLKPEVKDNAEIYEEKTHTLEGIKELARIQKVKPSDIEQKEFRAIDFAIYMQLAAEGDDDALVKAYSLWQKMSNDNYKHQNYWKFKEMQRFTYDKWVDYLIAKSKKDNGAAVVMKIIHSDPNFTNGVLRDSNYNKIQALIQQYYK